jgi:methionyl-tRNA synthetase
MLMAWNENSGEKYILPENVPANEFLNFEGQKFSKSRGWGIDVDEFLEEFPADALRYTLTMNLPEARDADFYWKDFQARNNNELADILGNFINRSLTFVHKNFNGAVPALGTLQKIDMELLAQLKSVALTSGGLFEKYRFKDATLEIMNLVRYANKYFNDSEPWKTLKDNPAHCSTTLNLCLQIARSLAILFEPILPFASVKIKNMLNLSLTSSEAGWLSAGELLLKDGHPLGRAEILFAKIEDEVIQKYIQKLPTQTPSSPEPMKFKPTITIDDFQKIDFRIAKVLQAERVPKSEKLVKLQVNIGTEQRQIVAGIAQHYKPEDLVGKKIVVIANLTPAKLMGQESNGMLLAASNTEGKLTIVVPQQDIDEGSIVK